MAEKYIDFYYGDENTSQTRKNRIKTVRDTNIQNKKVIDRNISGEKFASVTDVKKFFKLQNYADKGLSIDKPSTIATKLLNNEESTEVLDAINNQASFEVLKMFIDKYMSPLGSDISYRLGDVSHVKEFEYNSNKKVLDDIEKETFQTVNSHGEIDTAVNLRLETIINHSKYIKFGQRQEKNYYVNYFFPPYTNEPFMESPKLVGSPETGYSISTRTSNANEGDTINFDPVTLTAKGGNYTYRETAFKPINDNISLLQHLFERSTGIVSTYLTEWDLSLYMQEGLLTDKLDSTPSIIALTNRIQEDNPTGQTRTRSLCWGVTNCAVSKTALNGYVPNLQYWQPSDYYLSSYWFPYTGSLDTDGLDVFWQKHIDDAGFSSNSYNSFKNLGFRDKLLYTEEVGAACSGWKTWKNSYPYWQALYANSSDSLNDQDVLQITLSTTSYNVGDVYSSEGVTPGFISELRKILYETDSSLNPKKDVVENVSTIDYGNEAAGAPSSAGRKRDEFPSLLDKSSGDKRKESTLMSVADKELGSDKKDAVNGMLGKTSDSDGYAVNSVLAKTTGIPQKNPVLYGGPHGKYLNPRTVQGYFELDNAYLNGIPRIGPSIGSRSNFSSNRFDDYRNDKYEFGSNEEFYHSSNDTQENEASRSPAWSLHQLKRGFCETRKEWVQVWKPIVAYFPKRLEPYKVAVNYTERKLVIEYKTVKILWIKVKIPVRIRIETVNKTRWETRYKLVWPTTAGQNFNKNGPDIVDYNVPSVTWNGITYDVARGQNYKDFVKSNKTVSSSNYRYRSSYYYGNNYSISSSTYMSNWWAYYSCSSYCCSDYNRCSHVYYYGWEEWNSFYKYKQSNQVFYKAYAGTEYGLHPVNNGYSHFYRRHNYYRLMVRETEQRKRGLYHVWTWELVDRAIMHSEPQQKWNISRIRVSDYTIQTTWNKGGFWTRLLRFFAWSGYPIIAKQHITRVDSQKYRLSLPSSNSYTRSQSSYGKPTTYEYRTVNETDFMNKVLGQGSDNKSWKKVCFLGGNTSLLDRNKNGPRWMTQFKCKLSTYEYVYTIWTIVGREKKKCKWRSVWGEQKRVGKGTFIEVDVMNPNRIWDAINIQGYNNYNKGNYTEECDIPPEKYKTKLLTWHFADAVKVSQNSNITYNRMLGDDWKLDSDQVGIYGWGWLTALPGLETQFLKCDFFENANDYLDMRINKHRTNSQVANWNTKIGDINFTYCSQSKWDGGSVYKNADGIYYRTDLFHTTYKIKTMDSGLREAFRNMYTTSTLFAPPKFSNDQFDSSKDYSQAYIIDNASPIRTLASIASSQIEYLKRARDLMIDSINFNDVKRMIENVVEKAVLARSVSNDGNYFSSYGKADGRDPKNFYYNYWIEVAHNIFCSGQKDKNYYKNIFNSRISALESFLLSLGDKLVDYHVQNGKMQIGSAKSFSLNEYISIYKSVADIKDKFASKTKLGGDELETFMYAYLSVLYEYRKYFINKRFNKEDGTMWSMRHLEAFVPMALTAQNDTPIKEFEKTAGNAENRHSYAVSMIAQTNSPGDIAKAIQDKKPLDKSRVKKLYIKVKYTTKEAYDKYMASNNVNEQRIVYIPDRNKYAELPFDDIYQLMSTEYKKEEAIILKNEKTVKNGGIPDPLFGYDKYTIYINWFNDFDKNKGNTSFPKSEAFEEMAKENKVTILFGASNDVDINKLTALAKVGGEVSHSAIDDICSIKKESDYWVVPLTNKLPGVEGYKSNIFIKSYRERNKEDDLVVDDVTTNPASGILGYTLYPITYTQTSVVPGIAATLSDIGKKLNENLNYEG